MSRLMRFAIFCSLALAGCAAAEHQRFIERLWPEPPLTPRIKFIGLLRGQRDLSSSGVEWFTGSLFGRDESSDLRQPMGVAVSPNGTRLYVTDYASRTLFVFDFAMRRSSVLAPAAANFTSPLGVAVDEQERVYVVDALSRRVLVLDSRGRLLRTFTHRSFEHPTGIAVDSSRRRIYVADSASRNSDNHRIRIFDLDGNYLDSLGGAGREHGKLYFPTYLTLGADAVLYVTDSLNGRIEVFDVTGRYVKTFGRPGDTPGTFDKPKGVALDSFGNVYVVDSGWSNVQIFNQRGETLLFFGERGRGDGSLFNPTGIAVDRDNRIYVADAFNARISMYQLINTRVGDSVGPSPLRGR